ncbi:hypothetical protein V6N12_070404 [Hibiscus sabdariffa]|uniref:glycerophosphodiester phosphodiesterase n=1 Tax=Hibiscus sabdariffa TaxID=183260 RepID=A0ABR2FGP5_9ROSI
MKPSVGGRRRSHGTPQFRFSSFYSRLRFILILLAFVAILPPLFFHFRLRRFHQTQLSRCGWLNNPPIVCAHGGDSTNAFPNTMSAYGFALRSQVDCVEIDISRSSDGVLFALHDRDLQRISGNGTSKVGHLRSNEIKELDVHHQSGNSKIPTIEDALTLISTSVRQVILDAKVGPLLYEKGLAKDILSTVEKMQCKNCLIWAKSDSLVRDIIKLSPDVKINIYSVLQFLNLTCMLSSGAFAFMVFHLNKGYNVGVVELLLLTSLIDRMKGAKVTGVYHQLIDERLVKTLHGREKKVYAWTVDDAVSMTRMLHAHADAIITSNPSLLQRTMQDKRTRCLEGGFSLTR